MKNILNLFRFKNPLLESAALTPEQQARRALIKLGNTALQTALELEPETPEYERQMDLLNGYISLKQQLEKLTAGKEEQLHV